MNGIFFEITLTFLLATGLGIVARWLRQPTILGYIVAGIVVGPLGVLTLDNPEVLDALAELGIAFLLFLVGMEMRFDELRHVGRAALLTGAGQIVFTSVIGYGLLRLLGYAPLVSLYVAVALTFSSTIIVVKLLSEKNALESLYGKIVVGFLLVQDFVALGFLILLTSMPTGVPASLAALPWAAIGLAFAKGAALALVSLAAGRWLMPGLLKSVGRSQELVFLTSLAWGLGFAALASHPALGLSVEIGAFVAGLALTGSFERHQIVARVKSLRDFFIVSFFIILGSKMALSDVRAVAWPAALLSLFVLVGNPLIVLAIMGGLGFPARVSFLSSVTVAQISEFSLILMALGAKLGHVGSEAVSLVTVVGIVTIAASSYLILHSDAVYRLLRAPLRIFEFGHRRRTAKPANPPPKGHVVLVGCHRMGHNILDSLREMHKDFTVVDFNPEVVERLGRRSIAAIYGDATDPEIAERAGLADARLVISTIPTFDDSLRLLAFLGKRNPSAKRILTAEDEAEAVALYEHGADYVLLPHFIGGLQLARTIQEDGSLAALKALKARDLEIITNAP